MKVLEPRPLATELFKIRNRSKKTVAFNSKSTEEKSCLRSIESEIVNTSNTFHLDLLDTNRIFHLQQIRELCVAYRLRFLPIALFKQGLPDQAIDEWQRLEEVHQTSIEGLQIVAPSKSFHLKTYDDPMLFAPMGNDYYYLIHQWGADVSPWRKIKYWPIKNVITFLVFSLIVSALLTWLIPINKLGTSLMWAPFIVFLFMFKSIVGTVAYYFFMLGKNFNSEIWNRPFKEN